VTPRALDFIQNNAGRPLHRRGHSPTDAFGAAGPRRPIDIDDRGHRHARWRCDAHRGRGAAEPAGVLPQRSRPLNPVVFPLHPGGPLPISVVWIVGRSDRRIFAANLRDRGQPLADVAALEQCGLRLDPFADGPVDAVPFAVHDPGNIVAHPGGIRAAVTGFKLCDVPVAIVLGEHDEFIKLEHAEYLARNIPKAELLILPNVSHFAPLQRPEDFNRAMLAFIANTKAEG
jgi:pimeloyl-ACP methyl ester carboxylesterase